MVKRQLGRDRRAAGMARNVGARHSEVVEECRRVGGVFDATQKRSGDWGIGGNPLTTADVKNLAAGQPVA